MNPQVVAGIPRCRPIVLGTRGVDVIAVKRALARAGYIRWGNFTPVWGPHARRACRQFQQRSGIEPSTGNYGLRTHLALARAKRRESRQPAFDEYAASLMEQQCELLSVTPERAVRQAIEDAARYWIAQAARIDYHQWRPAALLKPPAVAAWWDCSSFATTCHYAAGAPNPNAQGGNRMPYNGLGYTGTLMDGGRKVSGVGNLKPGDLIFYGYTRSSSPAFPHGSPTHVAIYLGDGLVASHGSAGGPYLLPYRYRSDINSYYTYDVTP